MSQPRLPMRKLKEIARLRFEARRSLREIAATAGTSRSTVQLALARMSAAGLYWPRPAGSDEVQIESRVHSARPGPRAEGEPCGVAFAAMAQEIARWPRTSRHPPRPCR